MRHLYIKALLRVCLRTSPSIILLLNCNSATRSVFQRCAVLQEPRQQTQRSAARGNDGVRCGEQGDMTALLAPSYQNQALSLTFIACIIKGD
eukprot:1282274-Pleurochrysis_carterae.AAC.1